MPICFAERARALIGIRFRPQGRSSVGLDCAGVAMATFDLPQCDAPNDYALRGNRRSKLEATLAPHFRRISRTQLRPGDLMLFQVSPNQLHLAVRTDIGFVHAHAGLRRVVETPGLPGWKLLAVYRKRRTA